MSPISTHILDTSIGMPATGVEVVLEQEKDGAWVRIGSGTTNDDGRIGDLLPEGAKLEKGEYRLTFETGVYFSGQGREYFYPVIAIRFEIGDPGQHYHVPLLLNPFGYSTYRGS